MRTKLVLRLLDAGDVLLGWTEIMAEARGDGCLWTPGPVTVLADAAGRVRTLSTHWCDVNVETRVSLDVEVPAAGTPILVFASPAPVLRVGSMPGALPPVTIKRPVGVSVPAGRLASSGV